MNHGIDTGFLVAAAIGEHPHHRAANAKLASLSVQGDRFSLAPVVLTELVHVATDGRRFVSPPSVQEARNFAISWWGASNVDHVFPDDAATELFLQWHAQHRLGRKRLIDTMLAATYYAAGVDSILTTNAKDFAVFGCFSCITP